MDDLCIIQNISTKKKEKAGTQILTRVIRSHSKKGKLREFKFKFTKRENIDKKILRKFRKYLKEKRQKKTDCEMEIENIIQNNKFWTDFINKNLLPPFIYTEEEKEFKSFNTKYMFWIFEHSYSYELYNNFIQYNYTYVISHFERKYKISETHEEYCLLKAYINSLPSIYAAVTSMNMESMMTDSTSYQCKNINQRFSNSDIPQHKSFENEDSFSCDSQLINKLQCKLNQNETELNDSMDYNFCNETNGYFNPQSSDIFGEILKQKDKYYIFFIFLEISIFNLIIV